MTVERYLQDSAGDKRRKPPKNGVDKTKVVLQAQQQQ